MFKMTDRDHREVLHENSIAGAHLNTSTLKDEWLHITRPYGEMRMKQWIFDGVRIGFNDARFSKPITLDWEGAIDVVTMHFNLKGSMNIDRHRQDAIHFGNNEQNMFYHTESSGSMKLDDLHLKQFVVQFRKEAFLRIAGEGSDALKRFADQIGNGRTASFSNTSIPIGIGSQQAIAAVVNCKFSPALKRVFFLSKVMELLVLQADGQASLSGQKLNYIKSSHDKDRIVFAREYLMQHMDEPPTIGELSKIAAINEFKLKKGFKEVFGTTIFAYLAEARLQLAYEALKDGEKSISEIALEFGYASLQHFSAAFKKKFKVAPLQARKTL